MNKPNKQTNIQTDEERSGVFLSPRLPLWGVHMAMGCCQRHAVACAPACFVIPGSPGGCPRYRGMFHLHGGAAQHVTLRHAWTRGPHCSQSCRAATIHTVLYERNEAGGWKKDEVAKGQRLRDAGVGYSLSFLSLDLESLIWNPAL